MMLINPYMFGEVPLLEFQTNSPYTTTFDPSITVTGGGLLHWDLGDGNVKDLNSFSHTYADSSVKTVKVYKGTTTGSGSVTGIDISSDNILGIIDLSKFNNLATSILVFGNTNVTNVIFPQSSANALNTYVSLCNISPSLDLTPMINIGGTFSCYSNPNLNNIYLPTINKQFTTFRADVCGLYVASIDAIFSKLNTWYLGHPPTASLTINTSGGTNAAPTGGSNNTDILSLQAIFLAAGQTLTITKN